MTTKLASTHIPSTPTTPEEPSYIRVGKHGGTSIVGPKAMELYRLLTLRQALILEINTKMRMSRGASALQVAKKVTGLKTHNRHAHLAALTPMIDKLNQEVPRVREPQ